MNLVETAVRCPIWFPEFQNATNLAGGPKSLNQTVRAFGGAPSLGKWGQYEKDPEKKS